MADFRFVKLADPSHFLPIPGDGAFPALGRLVDFDEARLGAHWRWLLTDGSLVEDEVKTALAVKTLAAAGKDKFLEALEALHREFSGAKAVEDVASPHPSPLPQAGEGAVEA